MYSGALEFIAIILSVGCIYHAIRVEGRAFAEQWFIGAFFYGILRESFATAMLAMYAYTPQLTFLGAAPIFVSLFHGSLFYLALQFARRFIAPEKIGLTAAVVFPIAASFALPLETTAVQLEWWTFNRAGLLIFGGMRVFMLVVWGAGAALFCFAFARVRRTPLPDRGKLYAMITLAPIIALADLFVAFVAEN